MPQQDQYENMHMESPIMLKANVTKLHTIQNTALGIANGCTLDTDIQHLYGKINTLTLLIHLKLTHRKF